MFDAVGGGGWWRNAESGCTLYPACTFSTFGMSAGSKSWVRKRAREKGVVEKKTFLIPGGIVPFQSDPTKR
jgi:hypothetical protein